MSSSRMDAALKDSQLPQLRRQAQLIEGATAKDVYFNDSLAYIYNVMNTFQDNLGKYHAFRKIMKDFKNNRTSRDGVVARVMVLFDGYPELIVGFKAFLPCEKLTDEQALKLMQKIKRRFHGDSHVCQSLANNLDILMNGNNSNYDVQLKIATLLQGHPDLLVDFAQLLSGYSASKSANYMASGRNFMFEDANSATPRTQQLHIDENKTSIALQAGPDLDAGPSNNENGNTMTRVGKNSRHGDKERDSREGTQPKERKRNDRAHQNSERDRLRQSVAFADGCDYGDKERDSGERTQFKERECNDRARQNSERDRLRQNVGFADGCGHGDKKRDSGECTQFKERKPDDRARQNSERGRLSQIVAFADGCGHGDKEERGEGTQFKEREHDDRASHNYERESQSVTFADGCGPGRDMSPSSSNNKNMPQPIHELDLSNCEQCTPSYRLLPRTYLIPSASERTAIDVEVLNDHWVSTTSGSEDYSIRRINPYEQILFQCEDDRFELDMMLESVNVTTQRVEVLMEKIKNHTVKTDYLISIMDHLTDLNLRCIEHLYGDHGLDMVNQLRKNAALLLPVILTRLKQKQQEWSKCHSRFNKVWAEVLTKNYHKSLDHLSFNFKQRDQKSYSKKALLAEIQEIREKKLKEDDVLRVIALWNGSTVIPQLDFEYNDSNIYEDMYRLIKYSSEEVCTSEEFDKVMKIWKTFIEPLLGVPCRPQEVEDTKNAVKVKNRAVKTHAPSVANSDVFPDSGENVMHCKEFSSLENADDEQWRWSVNGSNTAERDCSLDLGCDARKDDICCTYPGLVRVQSKTLAEICGGDAGEAITQRLPKDTGIASEEDGENGNNNNEAESEFEAEGVSDALYVNGDGTLLSFLEHSSLSVRPLTKYIPPVLQSKGRGSQVFYGNDSFYVIFRLHRTLYERLQTAKNYSSARSKWEISNGENSTDPYARFMIALYGLLDGSSDNAKFEDECHATIGAQSFVLFTLDKLIYALVKQLRKIATDEFGNCLLELYTYENSRKPGRFADKVYQDNVRLILDDENIYRIEYLPASTSLRIQLMHYEKLRPEMMCVSLDPSIADYLYNDFLTVDQEKKINSGIFLKRNKRQYPCEDESSMTNQIMDGLLISNGLQYTIARNSSKRICSSEDLLYRPKRKRRSFCQNGFRRDLAMSLKGYAARVNQFHNFLARS